MSEPGGELNGVPSISADGRFAAWLSSGSAAVRLVLHDLARGREVHRGRVGAARCRAFTWTHLPGVGLAEAEADAAGAENWALHLVRVESGQWQRLGDGAARMRIAGLSERHPDQVVVAVDAAAPGHRDYLRICLRTGAGTPVLTGSAHAAVYFDRELRPRLAETVLPDGARELRHLDAGDGGRPTPGARYLHVPHEDALTARVLGFAADPARLHLVLPDGPDGVRLAELDCRPGAPAGAPRTLHRLAGGDYAGVLTGPDGRPELVHVERERLACVPLDGRWADAVQRLRAALGTEPEVLERRPGAWLVASHRPERDVHYLVHDPDGGGTRPLCEARPGRAPLPVECHPVEVPLRDGRRAVGYVTRPTGPRPPDGPGPAVLLVHGGPWRRSRWRYTERRAWLAARGCTVIEPNFRGSTGFGSGWISAADGQWGAAMQDDLEDTLDWAVAEGLADPDRIALVGGSYGGYAVLQLAATTDRPLRCAVASSPLTDLVGFVAEPPAFWRSAAPMLRRRIGDPARPEQRAALAERSPVNRAAGVRCPVLLVHGANDSRVPAAMATRMFMALARADRDATLALFPDEGHEVVTAANRAALDGLTAGFLDRWLRPAPAPGAPEPGPAPGSTVKLFDSPRAARRKAADPQNEEADHGHSPPRQ
ncbi:dipeptidyl aminopeptidase/acylaminoacyl peptidase [Kitasatospora sp. SolWspMP-SS2h]|uniref:alpha/beta hydrolase family protein n=1 Tax=Kitasatospora sp. SolWspMP-SS2h TaxID=1305729 RepID=UPI000DB9DE1C|nr:alpha/beta fold hydrolase [Kitasatospora sp. SolWspMP-SS2h]RAJ42427.1 dipeptidyl aminopeptidase/acylaminoacyl peptidase [Kitasatospora sp. SolWspMP-SS2h]